MTDVLHERALDARREFAANSAAIGITPGFIERMVETFYGRVRADAVLGPVFDGRLADRWPEHLAKMKSFWSAIAFMSGEYHGKPMEAHARVAGIEADHFALWLALFCATLEEIAPTPEAAAFFISRAERIAESLKLGLFYRPEAAAPRSAKARSTPNSAL